MSFFLSHWDDGPSRTLRLGAAHGLFCVGCCWALMLVGFATGVMSVWWMLILTAIVVVENLTRHGRTIGRVAGLGLILMALTACEEPFDCTAEFVSGITVHVTDAGSGAPLSEASGTIVDGSFVQQLESVDTGTLVGAGERPGTYDIVIMAPGYHAWTRTDVTLGFDGCHVIGQSFDAELEPVG